MMTRVVTLLLSAFFALTVTAHAGSTLNDGIAAYKAGDTETAWKIFRSSAEKGDARAQRRLGEIILANDAPVKSGNDPFLGVQYLKAAASAGDNLALITLEDLRRRRLAHSPTLDDIIELEKVRALDGDPVTAWRLAQRFQSGDGVSVSKEKEAFWLEIAATPKPEAFPKSNEAALRLCQLHVETASGGRNALKWCEVASQRGNSAARVILRRFASVPG